MAKKAGLPSPSPTAQLELVAYLPVKQRMRSFLLATLTAKTLVAIAYVAARGISKDEGAVQRILNTRRVSSLKEFAKKGGDYPASIVLNWTRGKLNRTHDTIHLPIESNSAQIIDGQHRFAGLKDAIRDDPAIGETQLPVAIYEGLTTQECADIFLSINTEQKQAPRSLVYDLYGLASDYMVDFAAHRAKDLASRLNDHDSSPYRNLIKFPGSPKTKGGVALSTAVAVLKPLVDRKAMFEQAGMRDLEAQTHVLMNYFSAIRLSYGSKWNDPDNAFLYAAGFSGAIDFLKSHLFEYCARNRDFTINQMQSVLSGLAEARILQSETKGLGGTESRRLVADRLKDAFEPAEHDHQSFRFG